MSLYRKALEFNSRRASWWYNLGIAYQKLGETRQAIEAYKRAVALEPKESQYRDVLNALRLLGEDDEDSGDQKAQ